MGKEKTGFGGCHVSYLHIINGSNTHLPRVFRDLHTTLTAERSLEDMDTGKTPVSQSSQHNQLRVTMSEMRGQRNTDNKAEAEVESDTSHGGQRVQVLPSRL